jgi:hypothetical protein
MGMTGTGCIVFAGFQKFVPAIMQAVNPEAARPDEMLIHCNSITAGDSNFHIHPGSS